MLGDVAPRVGTSVFGVPGGASQAPHHEGVAEATICRVFLLNKGKTAEKVPEMLRQDIEAVKLQRRPDVFGSEIRCTLC